MIPPGCIPDRLLVVVDWSWWLNAAYHGGGGVDSMLPYLVGKLAALLREPRPSHVAIALDSLGRTWRHDVLATYKAGREPKPAEFYQVSERALELAELWGVPLLSAEGFEADDVIAAAVDQARDADLATAIVSPDKDLMQLVSDDVLTWDGEGKTRWPGDVFAHIGVAPEQIPDWLAICGDKTDAIPGVPGIGKVHAAEILATYDTLEHALAVVPDRREIDQIPALERAQARARRAKDAEALQGIDTDLRNFRRLRNLAALLDRLQAHGAQVRQAHRLVSLRHDTPIRLDVDAAQARGGDRAELARRFREMGYYRLAEQAVIP